MVILIMPIVLEKASKEGVYLLGIRQVAVKYGKLPSRNSKLPLRITTALA